MKKVVFIIVNYNNSRHTLGFLKSISDSLLACPREIVIVDNCSVQEEIDLLIPLNDDNRIVLHMLRKNIGYFPALNYGYSRTNMADVDLCYIGNNDISFTSTLSNELNYLRENHSDKYVISPRIINRDGKNQNPHVIDEFSFFKLLYLDVINTSYILYILTRYVKRFVQHYQLLDIDNGCKSERSQYIFQGYGAGFFLMKPYLEHFRSIPSVCFLYNEEWFLANQLNSINQSMFYSERITLYHDENSATGKLAVKKKWLEMRKSHWAARKGMF